VSIAHFSHHIGDLARDLEQIAERAPADMEDVVRKNAREGNRIAKGFARESSGRHGKHYPGTFTAEQTARHTAEYGPDADIVVQGRKGAFNAGGMAPGFEGGSRNQKPHEDLARSADLIGPAFAHDVANLPDRWFW
jgi:hypothetical protein